MKRRSLKSSADILLKLESAVKTKIIGFTNSKIFLETMKLFAKLEVVLEKRALRFKLGS